jgi:hypothetical protein
VPAAAPGPPLRPRTLFIVLLAAAWLSAGPLPFGNAWREMRAPNDFTADYVTALAWVREGRAFRPLPAVLARDRANDYAVSVGARRILLLGPYYVHPPTALPALMPFTLLGYRAAVWAWQLASVALVLATGVLLAPLAAEAGAPLGAPLLSLLLLLWPPVLTNLELGQWSIPLAAALAAGHRAWERGARRRAAGFMALAAGLKLTPLLLAPFLALRDRRAALWFAGVFAFLAALALPFGGLDIWRALVRESAPNAHAWETFWHNGLSFTGLWARTFGGGAFARPWVAAPALARALVVICDGALFVLTLLATRAASAAGSDRQREGCVLALWYVLLVVLNPLGWPHNACLLLLPALLVARAGAALARPRTRTLVGVALVLLTIPKETLGALAPPPPARFPGSLVLSLPLLGALVLYAAAAEIAFARPRAAA